MDTTRISLPRSWWQSPDDEIDQLRHTYAEVTPKDDIRFTFPVIQSRDNQTNLRYGADVHVVAAVTLVFPPDVRRNILQYKFLGFAAEG